MSPLWIIRSVMALLLASSTWNSVAQESQTLYMNDLQSAELDKVPDELLVLDGAFVVKEQQNNRFLELPGAPLDSFGLLFGPTESEGIAASARVFGLAKGRRAPTFAVGVNGAGGYRLQVSPAKNLIELYRGDVAKTNQPFRWQSGQWTHLKIQVLKSGSAWEIRGKVWMAGTPEPSDWLIRTEETQELPPGRAAIFGSPYAGTPIRFDDLTVVRAPK